MSTCLYLYGFVRNWWREVPLWFDASNGHRTHRMPDEVPFTGLTFPA